MPISNAELINYLQQCDDEAPAKIAQMQDFGTNWEYEIESAVEINGTVYLIIGDQEDIPEENAKVLASDHGL